MIQHKPTVLRCGSWNLEGKIGKHVPEQKSRSIISGNRRLVDFSDTTTMDFFTMVFLQEFH